MSWRIWVIRSLCRPGAVLAAGSSPGTWRKTGTTIFPCLSTKSRPPNLPTVSKCWANREEYVVLTANRNSGLYINRTDCQITVCVLFWGALGLVSDLFVQEDKQLEINEWSLECVTAWAHGLPWISMKENTSPWIEEEERVKVAEAGYRQHVLSWTITSWYLSPLFSTTISLTTIISTFI